METRKQIAAEKKRCNSHNCAQAILHTYADIAGISEDEAMNIVIAMGTGIWVTVAVKPKHLSLWLPRLIFFHTLFDSFAKLHLFSYIVCKKRNCYTSLDRKRGLSFILSIIEAFVHTSWRRISAFSWNHPNFAVTLHCRKEKDDTVNDKV